MTARGNARQAIVLDDEDRAAFVGLLGRVVERYGLRLHAFCLMDNHYHLLVETPKANLAEAMRQLNGVATQAYNRRHRRVGHLFQGRYKAILVERESHLLELARYVVLNPVRAKACASPEEWRWSSYRATAGLEPAPSFLDVDWILAQFGQGRRRAQERYRVHVAEGLGAAPFGDLRGGVFLGGEDFVARHAPAMAQEHEVPRSQRQPLRPSLAELFAAGGEQAMVAAHREHGYRLAEIAEQLGVHYATVSRRLRLLEEGHPLPPRRRRHRG